MSNWTLFSNHGHVLVCLARDSDARLRDVASDVGLTERAVQKIVRDLQQSGMVSVSKQGRRNRYRIHRKVNLRHTLEAHCSVGGLMKFVDKPLETNPANVIRSIEPKPVRTGVTEKTVVEQTMGRQAPQAQKQAVLETKVKDPLVANKSSPEKAAEKPPEKQQGSLF